jgi:uncharacterized protein YjbJ (UPF0337 family)
MNWDGITSGWDVVKVDIKGRWDKLSEEDLQGIAGSRDQLVGRLQALYGLNAEGAEAQVRDWERHQEPIFFARAARSAATVPILPVVTLATVRAATAPISPAMTLATATTTPISPAPLS